MNRIETTIEYLKWVKSSVKYKIEGKRHLSWKQEKELIKIINDCVERYGKEEAFKRLDGLLKKFKRDKERVKGGDESG